MSPRSETGGVGAFATSSRKRGEVYDAQFI
jgi:hypothetical protein